VLSALSEWLLVAVALALGVRALGVRERHAPLLLAAMLVAGTAAAVAMTRATSPPPPEPITRGVAGFTGSGSCRSCHLAEYSSWHASYHRRMTQPATLANVAAPELRQGGRLRVETNGRSVELFSKQGSLWARLPDPGVTAAAGGDAFEASFRAAPIRDVPIQLVTGSHHHQAYWVGGARSGELSVLPAVYVIDEARLIPRRDAFLNPPDAPERGARWNSNCVQCHSVAGAPGHDLARDVFDTSVAELGIACEACHGQAEEHVRAMQSPLARYRAHAEKRAPHVVEPSKLTPERSSQVCGRCHSYFFPKQEAEWWQHGFTRSYAPGGELSLAQLLLDPETLRAPDAPQLLASAESLFYADGTIRIGGREYNGLVRSPCYERGHGERKLTCLSCHSLHRGEPDDQLHPERLGNQACASCHAQKVAQPSAHTHHAAASTGSLCYNCHMPHTSYALLGAIRSHRVSSPAFDATVSDRPSACSLCHLDRSEAWAAEQARAWYGTKPSFELTAERAAETAPAGALHGLSGDAAVRAITAAALGRQESSQAALALRRQLLSELERDDYAAVRQVAMRAERKLPPDQGPPPLDAVTVERLLRARDRRPVTIAE
jgi:hypothetical protein